MSRLNAYNGLLYKKAGYVFTIHFEGDTEFKTIGALKLFKSLYSGYVVDSIIEKIQNYHFECHNRKPIG